MLLCLSSEVPEQLSGRKLFMVAINIKKSSTVRIWESNNENESKRLQLCIGLAVVLCGRAARSTSCEPHPGRLWQEDMLMLSVWHCERGAWLVHSAEATQITDCRPALQTRGAVDLQK